MELSEVERQIHLLEREMERAEEYGDYEVIEHVSQRLEDFKRKRDEILEANST